MLKIEDYQNFISSLKKICKDNIPGYPEFDLVTTPGFTVGLRYGSIEAYYDILNLIETFEKTNVNS